MFLTSWFGGGSSSRVVSSGPSTVTYGTPQTSSFSAGNRVMISWPVAVTTTSYSMRAALQPSLLGQKVSSANTIPGLIS